MATNTATAADLSKRSLRPLTPLEVQVAGVWLDDAFRQIVVELPAVAAMLDGPDVSADFVQTVVRVQCAMVLRVFSNPDGVLEETIDDHTRRLDAAVSSGVLAITPGERTLLDVAAGAPEGAFAVRARPASAWADRPGGWFPATTTDTW